MKSSLNVSPGWNHRGPVVVITAHEDGESDQEHRLTGDEIADFIAGLEKARERATDMFEKNTGKKS